MPGSVSAHPVEQLFAQLEREEESWRVEILFDAAFALPEFRKDDDAPPPTREWLTGLSEADYARIREGAEEFMRREIRFMVDDELLDWTMGFPDFQESPPRFPALLNGGAYLRVEVKGKLPRRGGVLELGLGKDAGPNLVVSVGSEGEPNYVTVSPEGRAALFQFEERGSIEAFRWIAAVGGGLLLVWVWVLGRKIWATT